MIVVLDESGEELPLEERDFEEEQLDQVRLISYFSNLTNRLIN